MRELPMMKETFALILLLSLVVLAAWKDYESRGKANLEGTLNSAANQYDPAGMSLSRAEPMKSHTLLPDGIECGLLHLADGSEVKFWFLSHHIGPGLGLTRFDFADGTRAYLRGYFCCEVEVKDEAISDKASLLAFLAEKDGTPP